VTDIFRATGVDSPKVEGDDNDKEGTEGAEAGGPDPSEFCALLARIYASEQWLPFNLALDLPLGCIHYVVLVL